MRYDRASLVGCTLVALAATAQAQPAIGTESHKASGIEVVGKLPDRKVCRTSVPTGSIFPQTVCKTLSETEYEHQQSLAAMHQIMDKQILEQTAHANPGKDR